MFWDKVAWAYDLFADIYNGKTHRELCREVAGLVSTTDDVLECACGTGMLTVHIAPVCRRIVATGFSHKMLRKAGADFKRQFTLSSYKEFFTDAGYEDVILTMVEGHVPCAIAVMTKQITSGESMGISGVKEWSSGSAILKGKK